MGRQRTLTESQYEALRHYEDGNPRWVRGGPLASLVSRGLIRGDGRRHGFYRITEAGRLALAAARTRLGSSLPW